MQEEIEHKTVNLAISTTKLSARTLLRGMQFLLRQYDKHASQGKQSISRPKKNVLKLPKKSVCVKSGMKPTFAVRPMDGRMPTTRSIKQRRKRL